MGKNRGCGKSVGKHRKNGRFRDGSTTVPDGSMSQTTVKRTVPRRFQDGSYGKTTFLLHSSVYAPGVWEITAKCSFPIGTVLEPSWIRPFYCSLGHGSVRIRRGSVGGSVRFSDVFLHFSYTPRHIRCAPIILL